MTRVTAFTLCALVCGACAGTETGNPVHGDVHIGYAPLTTGFTSHSGKRYDLEEAKLDLQRFVIRSCAGTDVPVFATRQSRELVGHDRDTVELAPVTHCSVSLSVVSVSVAFATKSGDAAIDIRRAVRTEVDLLVDDPEMLRGPERWLVVAADVAQWIGPLGSDLQPDAEDAGSDVPADGGSSAGGGGGGGNGVADAGTANSQPSLATAVSRSIALYEDLNHDGELDAKERARKPIAHVAGVIAD